MTSYILGIDIGTGSTKAVAVTKKGEAILTVQSAYPTLTPKEGYSEQNPQLIWEAFLSCIIRAVQTLKEPPLAISISSAMHSLIPVDSQGVPLMNMITWADNRSASIAERIKKSALGEMLYEQTGTPLHSMSPLCKIIWLRENENDLFQKTYKFISIKEFIWHKLFDVYEIDHSIASATGLFDIEKLSWNSNALLLAEIRASHLSVPVSTNHQQKKLKPAATLALEIVTNVPFVIGASDGCMANLGSFATEPGIAALTIGTSGAIRVGNTKPTYNFAAMNFNYRLDENTFISGGPINNGGVILKWYIQKFLKAELTTANDYSEILNKIEGIEAGAEGLIFLPYLLGERAPIWNSHARGVFFGISNQHEQAHFTRAVVEGITMALYHVANGLERSGLAIKQINVSGGFVHSTVWLQILANIFNKKICLVNAGDASAMGAAYMAMKSLSLISSYKDLEPANTTTFLPDVEQHQLHQESFLVYKKLYKNLKDLME